MKTREDFEALLRNALTFEEWSKAVTPRMSDPSSAVNMRTSKGDREDVKFTIEKMAVTASESMPVQEVFHPYIASALINKAESMPAAVEYLAQPFLAACAGLIGTSVKVQVKKGYKQPIVVWTAFFGNAGTLKTPAMNSVVQPLVKLQSEAIAKYEEEYEAYKEAKHKWDALSKEDKANDGDGEPEEPTVRDFYIRDFTVEGVISAAVEKKNSKGFSILADELSGTFNSLDQYKGGNKGNDRQRLLEWWNGGDIKRNLSGKKQFLEESAISICGGIQPSVWEKMMSRDNEDDGDGLSGRFCMCHPKYVPAEWTDKECDIDEFLTGLYQNLDEMPSMTLEFSQEAREYYKEFQNWIARQHPLLEMALQNAYSKMRGYAVRFAGLLHCIDIAVDADKPLDLQISGETMLRAIKLCSYYLRQIRLIRGSDFVFGDADEKSVYKKIAKLVEFSRDVARSNPESGGWISPRDIQMKRFHVGLGEDAWKADEIRELFTKMAVELETGELDQQTRAWRWRATPPNAESLRSAEAMLNSPSAAESFDVPEMQPFAEMLNRNPESGDNAEIPPPPKQITRRFGNGRKSCSAVQQTAVTTAGQGKSMLTAPFSSVQQTDSSSANDSANGFEDLPIDGDNRYGF